MPFEGKGPTRSRDEEFVQWLHGLNEERVGQAGKRPKERAVLATLRRGLGRTPGTAIEMYPYIMPFGPWASEWTMRSYFLVASLFASHPAPGGIGNMGATLAAVQHLSGSGSIERRFVALLNSHPDDLHQHLRHAVSLARSKDVPVNWLQLLYDVKAWPHAARRVHRSWAMVFWTGQRPVAPAGTGEKTVEEKTIGE